MTLRSSGAAGLSPTAGALAADTLSSQAKSPFQRR